MGNVVARNREVPRREFFVHAFPRKLVLVAQLARGILDTMQNPFEFIQQVRAEATRVTWPTRRETLITTIWVLVLAVAASLFLLVVDEGLANSREPSARLRPARLSAPDRILS